MFDSVTYIVKDKIIQFVEQGHLNNKKHTADKMVTEPNTLLTEGRKSGKTSHVYLSCMLLA